MPNLPRQIRLAAGDYFMHGQDRRMRRLGLPGNVCRVSLSLDPGLNVPLLRERIQQSPILDWMAHARVVRTFPLLPPRWRIVEDSSPVLHEHHLPSGAGAGVGGLPPVVAQRDLHPGQGPAIAVDLVHYPDESRQLVLTWSHTLMDARGAEFVLRHLNPVGAKPGPTAENLVNPTQLKRSLAERWRRLKMARSSLKWLRESGREPLFTLMPALQPGGRCSSHLRLMPFTQEETAAIDARSQSFNAGFQRSHFYLAAALRGLHAVAALRGNRDGAYLVPVPHDMRRRGGNGPIFSNQLSILFYRIEPRLAGSLSQIVAELNRQMMDQIRAQFPDSCMAALDLFKPLPLDYYVRHLGQPSGGKFASLCFSDSGETCQGMADFVGGPIQRVTHLVPTWRPPGLTVLFWRYGQQLSSLLSWVDDCLSPSEADLLERGLRAGLLEEAIS